MYISLFRLYYLIEISLADLLQLFWSFRLFIARAKQSRSFRSSLQSRARKKRKKRFSDCSGTIFKSDGYWTSCMRRPLSRSSVLFFPLLAPPRNPMRSLPVQLLKEHNFSKSLHRKRETFRSTWFSTFSLRLLILPSKYTSVAAERRGRRRTCRKCRTCAEFALKSSLCKRAE